MPGKVKVRVLAARNLPVMDRSSETTDAFAEVKLGDLTFKTEVCRKSLHPNWNSDWYRFDVDDCELQEEPLQIRIMDYDTYSANDAIGKVYIDLNPLLLKADSHRVASDGSKQIMLNGWLPIFDTMHGVRGEVNVQVKVELFSDLNKFRQSSCGVLFFNTPAVPEGFRVQCINGFVEKLVVNDDPEYQWIDKIRTPRASNEARQSLFMKLSSIVQRKIGLMALELGANAVLGYKQNFDLEGDTGIVVRGIGTAVVLVKQVDVPELKEYSIRSLVNRMYRNPEGRSMSHLTEAMMPFFQNLSMPWSLDDTSLPPLARSGSGVGSLVGSLTAAAVSIGRSLATSPSTTQSWLTRKSSFKAAARTIRSVSVTTMAAAVRSPQHHHRVASFKSAKAALMRKSSESESVCTTSSQDATSISMPPLESDDHVAAVFQISTDGSNDESSQYEDSFPSEDDDDEDSKVEVAISNEVEVDTKGKTKEETEWAIQALKLRRDKGRIDSTSTNEVTFINTILNQNMTLTDEGNAIRRRIAADETEPVLRRQTSEDASSSATLDPPPILTIEPPSPMPSCVSPGFSGSKSNQESDSEVTTASNSLFVPISSSCDHDTNLGNPTMTEGRRRRCGVAKRRHGHSFHSVRERAWRSRSDSRSSSEPPLVMPQVLLPASNMTLTESNTSLHVKSFHRYIDTTSKTTGGGGSRHASGESNTTGCSPKGVSTMGAHVSSQQQILSAKKSSKSFMMSRDGPDLLEYPFLTLQSFPEGFIQRLGGLVCCRSVKMLDGELEENRTQRENWWHEIRQEIRSHARCLGCNLVIGYTEATSIWDDLVVLSASGTAAVGNLNFMLDLDPLGLFGAPYLSLGSRQNTSNKPSMNLGSNDEANNLCKLLHVTSNDGLPHSWRINSCHICGKFPVPDVMFTTIEPPVNQLAVAGRGCLLQAKVLRAKKDLKGESNAKEISDALPFIEYELHRQLLNKLKVKGMNAIFGLKMHLSISDRVMVASATGTGVHLCGLPSPTPPRLVHHRDDQEYLRRMQRRLEEKISENKIYHGINEESRRRSMSTNEGDAEEDQDQHCTEAFDNESEIADMDGLFTNKETCVLEIDDTEDADILDSILDRFPPNGIQVFSIEELVGITAGHFVRTSQMFTQVWRGRAQPTTKDLTRISQKLLSSIYFKLRRFRPCIVSKLQIKIDVDDEYELQVTVSGMAIALAHGGKTRSELAKELSSIDCSSENEDSIAESKAPLPAKLLMKSSTFFVEAKAPEGVVLTSQSYICGAKVDKYLGNLNFFLIRETSSLREAGGLNTFVQSFICEIHAIMRAHVLALGGNALISYFMSEFVILHNPHKNQAQCLIHVGGDAVQACYITS